MDIFRYFVYLGLEINDVNLDLNQIISCVCLVFQLGNLSDIGDAVAGIFSHRERVSEFRLTRLFLYRGVPRGGVQGFRN